MLGRIEELALIGQCVAFDNRRAFARLVDEHAPALRSFIFNLTLGDASLTDDIAQETFIKAYTGLRSFKGTSRFRTWLFRIAYNEFINYCRKTNELLLDDCKSVDPGSDSPTTSSDIRMDLETALSELSTIERTVVLLFFYEDKPIKDICKITDLSEGSVKSHIYRAKKKLSKVLKTV